MESRAGEPSGREPRQRSPDSVEELETTLPDWGHGQAKMGAGHIPITFYLLAFDWDSLDRGTATT